ncbi:MAG: aminotransferase [Acidithiobacillales bacterium SG8_45]|nr:MAG: aminotransferase [Acidithiobacillales bacterium SG8_45]
MLNGLFQMPWWGYVLTTLALTHITIASVTIFLHRHQAHRALELHPVVSHFFRFWLWLTTGMITREWAAIHRKHHAKVETADDPHSPIQKGLNRVLWTGAFLYHDESKNRGTIEQYGFGTPDDWLERHLYTPLNWLGIVLMLGIDLILFGPLAGGIIWLVQMVWIPFWAAGVINGIGHYWGYRNFEVADASTNIVPWGILIGGEELHNNHHTYGSSAKLSAKWWEFDIGWMYIRILQAFGLARVKKLPPQLVSDPAKNTIDLDTVRAVVRNRFQIMARFSRDVLKHVQRDELRKLDRKNRDEWALIKKARRLMKREPGHLSESKRQQLSMVLERSSSLNTVYQMKKKLQAIWESRTATQENLLRALEDWCRQAEATGIKALEDFSSRIRTYTLAPVRTT